MQSRDCVSTRQDARSWNLTENCSRLFVPVHDSFKSFQLFISAWVRPVWADLTHFHSSSPRKHNKSWLSKKKKKTHPSATNSQASFSGSLNIYEASEDVRDWGFFSDSNNNNKSSETPDSDQSALRKTSFQLRSLHKYAHRSSFVTFREINQASVSTRAALGSERSAGR